MGKKGDLRRAQIIEGASYCLTRLGDRKTTFQAIADYCKVSQPLVVRHFKNRENIFPVVLDYWIRRAVVRTEEAMAKSGSPEEKIRNYLRVSIEIFRDGDFSQIYILLHYLAMSDEVYRLQNTKIKTTAIARITKMIEEGIKDGSFQSVNAELTAKVIHNSLVGFVISSVTEANNPLWLKLPQELEKTCLQLLLTNNSHHQ